MVFPSPEENRRLWLVRQVLEEGSLLRGALDGLADAIALALDVPIALVSLVDSDEQHFIGQSGMPDEVASGTPISHSFCRHVVTAAAPLVVDTAVDDARVCTNPAIEDLGVAAYAGQPIVVHDHVLGSLCAIDHVPRVWTPRELAALRAFADVVEYLIRARVSTQSELLDERAWANARDQRQSAQLADYQRLTAEQSEAAALSRRFQTALLPHSVPPRGMHVDVLYRAGSDRLLLGGDFVDTMLGDDDTLSFVIGDVAGHGPEAAALAISLRASWHALERIGIDLPRIAAELDAQALGVDLHATALLGRITADGHLSVLSAGHPLPVIARPGHAQELALAPGPMLGLDLVSPHWPTSSCMLGGRTLLVYTDGLIEGHVDGTRERFGIERLLSAVAERGTDPERLCDVAVRANRGPLPDDVAILRLQPAG